MSNMIMDMKINIHYKNVNSFYRLVMKGYYSSRETDSNRILINSSLVHSK